MECLDGGSDMPLSETPSNDVEIATTNLPMAANGDCCNALSLPPPATDSSIDQQELVVSNASTSPYELDLTLCYPHAPLYNGGDSLVDSKVGTIRSRVILEQALRMYPTNDRLQEAMEERIVRWRPPASQHGTDAVMHGNHIFQQEPESTEWPLPNLKYLWDWLWQDGGLHSDDNCLSSGTGNGENDGKKVQAVVLPDLENQTLDLTQFKPNSSKSMLVARQMAPLHVDSLVPELPTTPRAILWSDFELNYNKDEDPNCIQQIDSQELMASMDEEVQNLVDGVDNFILGCFSSATIYICSCW